MMIGPSLALTHFLLVQALPWDSAPIFPTHSALKALGALPLSMVLNLVGFTQQCSGNDPGLKH